MPTAYIETSVPSYYVARPSSSLIQAARQATTRSWWDGGCSGLELYTSLETLDEAGRGDKQMIEARLRLLEDIPLLQINQAAASLATQLVSKRVIPASAGSDAVHIAVASVHATDFLVTWNFRHIANPFLRDRLRREVADFGAVLPVICTPEELLQDGESD
jgi:hypothetical protein